MAGSDELELIEGKVIVLDGEAFVRKHVKNCVLVYRGGTPPLMQNSTFESSTFRFEGAAWNTLDFLQILAASGSADMVAAMVGLLRPAQEQEATNMQDEATNG